MLRNVWLAEIHNILPGSDDNEKNTVAVFSDLAPLEPTYALTAGNREMVHLTGIAYGGLSLD